MQGNPVVSEVAYKKDMAVHGAALDRFLDDICGEQPVTQPEKQGTAGVAVGGSVIFAQEVIDFRAVEAPGDVAANDRQGNMI